MLGVIFVLIIAAAVTYYVKVYNSPNARQVRELCKGKTEEQAKTIEYFMKEGCLTKTISDDE